MTCAIYTVIAAIFFALANPGFVAAKGLAFFAWFYYVPVFFITRKSSFKLVWLYGAFYGAISFGLYIYWMALRHYTAGFLFVVVAYFFYYGVTFLLMKLADKFFPKRGWILQCALLVFAEYFRTTGFLGVNYGVSGYTQWRHPLVLAVARLGGVWAVSALLIFSSGVIYKILSDAFAGEGISASEKTSFVGKVFAGVNDLPLGKKFDVNVITRCVLRSVKKHIVAVAVFCAVLCACLCYGAAVQNDWSDYETVRVAAIQNNTDPWIGGLPAYTQDIENLKMLTDKALAEDSSIKLVVWSETSVVPSVMLHYTQRRDRARFELIKSLLEYIEEKDAVFVFGNDHAVPGSGQYNDDYNAVLVFTPKKNTIPPQPEIYSKQHLVPFTEYFPWEKQLPKIYEMLLAGDTHMWTPGKEPTVFHAAGLSFSTPVCFEDTFGDGSRAMVLNGARAIVNLSNDAWSKSLACQNQHLAMATLRCVENSVPAVRSTASGETCILNPNGKIVARAKSFEMDYVIGDVPVLGDDMKLTVFTKFGDWLPIFCAIIYATCLFFGLVKTHKKEV